MNGEHGINLPCSTVGTDDRKKLSDVRKDISIIAKEVLVTHIFGKGLSIDGEIEIAVIVGHDIDETARY